MSNTHYAWRAAIFFVQNAHNLVHHCSGNPKIKSLIINTLVIDNNHISKDMVSTKAQMKTKSALPSMIRTENKDIDNWMENYEDDYYFEEKDFQDCKSNLFLSGKLSKITEGDEKTIIYCQIQLIPKRFTFAKMNYISKSLHSNLNKSFKFMYQTA